MPSKEVTEIIPFRVGHRQMRQQIEIDVDLTFSWHAMAEGKSERLEEGLPEA